MRLIDADRLKEKMATTLEVLKHIFPPGEQEAHLISAFATVGEMADDCPTIDAVPVVLCKDCVHYWEEWGEEFCRRGLMYTNVSADWFCADGERKDDERTDENQR